MRAKAKKGQYIGAFAPYGYMKDPENKNHLLVDPETAPVVRRIFDMAIDGKIVSEIATALNREKIETPAQYFRRIFPDKKKHRKVSKGNSWDSSKSENLTQERCVVPERQWKNMVEHTLCDE